MVLKDEGLGGLILIFFFATTMFSRPATMKSNSSPAKTPIRMFLIVLCLWGNVIVLTSTSQVGLPWIVLSREGDGFVEKESGSAFRPWGFNYDHDAEGRLLEDYWELSWPLVVEDFLEMKELGANMVRIHLQLGKFMSGPGRPKWSALQQLGRVVTLAENTGLYLDVTGLGCYDQADVPSWYEALAEEQRWEVQAHFWESVAGVCASSPAVFCYDLMNEPILPGENKVETDWLAGAFAGKHFVQRISLDLKRRSREEVARVWVNRMVSAIRKKDSRHLITVGVIPWALAFPGAKPLFYAPAVGEKLDFVSVHFYPESGQVETAVEALKVYDVGKPLVVEEVFPLRCDTKELGGFMDQTRNVVDGWIGFYWGKTMDEYFGVQGDVGAAMTRAWLEFFKERGKSRIDE